jgi:hypothetical protein
MPAYINIRRREFYMHQKCKRRKTDLGASAKPVAKNKSDYSLTGKPTKTASCFAPAVIQSIASSLISTTILIVLFSCPRKTRALRSHQIDQQTRIARVRAPFAFAEEDEPTSFLNHSGIGRSGAHLCGLKPGQLHQCPICFQISATERTKILIRPFPH